MMPIAVITGATGFIGRGLIARMQEDRVYKIKQAVRSQPVTTTRDDSNSMFEIGEICGSTDWNRALEGADVVVHLAARAHMLSDSAEEPLAEYRKVNVGGTENLARAAAASGVTRFVYVSSVGVNGSQTVIGHPYSELDKPNPHSAYALSKWEAEQRLMRVSQATGMEAVIIRPPLVYGKDAPGNFAQLLKIVRKGIPLPLASLRNLRSFVALDNLLDFIAICVEHPQAANQTFLVSDGHDLSTAELIRGLARETNMPARLVSAPVWALRAGAALIGKGDTVQRLCGSLQVDISKARNLLGWTPPISVEEGLHRAVTETC